VGGDFGGVDHLRVHLIIAEATQQALRDDFSMAWYRPMLGAATSYLLSASKEEQLEQMTV
jgi:hypothetical protein